VGVAEVRWLDPEQRAAWLRLVAVLELLPAALDAKLARDEGLTLFEYLCLAMLSETPDRTLRMTVLAARTNATLPRLSRVISGLERAGLVVREPCPGDRRATNAVLTPAGWAKIVQAAPGHVTTVRELVIDALTPTQLAQLARICDRLLVRLDPGGRMLGAIEQTPEISLDSHHSGHKAAY
jgi:DNA-binding MarR family transcriptional regulator